jgi:hypothetical protein
MTDPTQQASETFDIGEVAIYWRPGAIGHGMDVTIAGVEYRRDGVDHLTGVQLDAGMFYVLAEPSPRNGMRWLVTSRVLRKKRPPAERPRVVSWESCPWKPESINV